MDNDKETLFLCKPCAEEMKKNYKTVASVEYIRPARDKGTCEQCGRRRFGYICEVEYRPLTPSGSSPFKGAEEEAKNKGKRHNR